MANEAKANRGSGQRKQLSPLFTWRSAIVESDLPPTHRHVALTLSLHMNERGGSCFPSIPTLRDETGLAESTVRAALVALDTAGWLVREVNQGGRGKSNRYTATVPGNPPADGGFSDGNPPADDEKPTGRRRRGRKESVEGTSNPFGVEGSNTQARARAPRDDAFDTLAAATGSNPAFDGKAIGKALSAIVEASEPGMDEVRRRHRQRILADSPELDDLPSEAAAAIEQAAFGRLAREIEERAAKYRQCRPDWELTAMALAKHWNRIPSWTPERNGTRHRDEAEQAWQRVLQGADLTARDKRALKAIGGSFTVRSSTHLPTTRRDFLAAWDDTG